MHMIHDPSAPPAATIPFDAFLALDIRIGTIIAAEPLQGARNPSMKIVIDFGAGVGKRKSAARITELYAAHALVGKQVAAVVNFRPRQIGSFMSEVLTLGFSTSEGAITLFSPDHPVPDGARLC